MRTLLTIKLLIVHFTWKLNVLNILLTIAGDIRGRWKEKKLWRAKFEVSSTKTLVQKAVFLRLKKNVKANPPKYLFDIT